MHVAKQIQRPMWDVKTFSPDAFHSSMKSRSPRQVGMLQALSSGKHVTEDGLKHYARTWCNGQCIHCGQNDSKRHRVYECPRFQSVRDRYKAELRWLKRQGEAYMAFGVVPDDNSALLLKKQLRQTLTVSVPAPKQPTEHQVVFTDGACHFGKRWD